ncbi:hypothetical protein PO883_28290 [Massilia sp. DJPM01]|uniref:hypothetical protein n=1 Tax=Massilia sp. DJPM01 TaxID=3024404 RepID=UPI00259E6E60|nr:hypothetical protein [Massilia sp. DJPM01]MDM5181088.1 hypothetical protein [Massilia sp. DJPM01]
MTQAIASSTSSAAYAYGAAKASPVTLQAQLQRYQQQLSDCVNCASADTPQGKSDIQAIAARITQVRQRIDQESGSAATPAAATASAPSATAATVTAGAPSATSSGNIIDVYA